MKILILITSLFLTSCELLKRQPKEEVSTPMDRMIENQITTLSYEISL